MTAEGLAEDSDIDISQDTWEERFSPLAINWIEDCLFRCWLSYYDLTLDELLELAEEQGIELDDGDTETNSSSNYIPQPENEICPCGDSLPDHPPQISSRWEETGAYSGGLFQLLRGNQFPDIITETIKSAPSPDRDSITLEGIEFTRLKH